jgi:hypothetical protein
LRRMRVCRCSAVEVRMIRFRDSWEIRAYPFRGRVFAAQTVPGAPTNRGWLPTPFRGVSWIPRPRARRWWPRCCGHDSRSAGSSGPATASGGSPTSRPARDRRSRNRSAPTIARLAGWVVRFPKQPKPLRPSRIYFTFRNSGPFEAWSIAPVLGRSNVSRDQPNAAPNMEGNEGLRIPAGRVSMRSPRGSTGQMLGSRPSEPCYSRSEPLGLQITQIYEGTNQVQRVVMARQLLNR